MTNSKSPPSGARALDVAASDAMLSGLALALQVAYAAPEGCPDRAAFLEAIEQRTGTADADLSFDVSIETASDGKATGELRIGDEAPRIVSAASCSEVVDALAVIAALAIEAAPVRAAPPTEEPSPSSKDAAPSPARDTAPFVPSAPREEPDPAKRIALAGMGLAHFTTVPSVGSVVGWGGVFELWTDPRASSTYRLSIVRTDSLAVDRLAPLAWQRWTWARVEACPLRFGTLVAVQPCAGFTGGILESGAGPSDTIEGRTRPWLSVGAGIRAATGGEPWLVSIEAGAVAPLVRDTFQLERSGTTYRVPAVLFGFAAGLGLRFR